MKNLDALKAATWPLHTKAERSGVIAEILAGSARHESIALLLRNLLPVYKALDATSLGLPEIVRSAAIDADLGILAARALPVLPQATAYADRVVLASQGNGKRLIAHAYVRYLGDLNGGLILKRRLRVCLGPVADKLLFYDYPRLTDPKAFTKTYRQALDQAVLAADFDDVVDEAVTAFELNIALSKAVLVT